jgi:signal transduction histidine kinase/HAMP domain-containing protein
MKLIYKITLVIVSLSLAVSAVFAFLVYSFTEASLQKAIATQQLELARQAMDKVDRLLYERYNGIIAISEDEEFEGLLAGKDINDKKEVAESEKKLRELALYTGPWDDLDLVNREGSIVFSTSRNEINSDITEHHLEKDIFTRILAGNIYYSDVYLDEERNKPVMVFAAPVRNEDDPRQPVVGAVVGHLSWQAVLEILQSTKASQVKLINNKGIEIGDNYSDHENEIFKVDESNNKAVQLALRGKSGSEVLEKTEGLAGEKESEGSLTSYVGEKGFLTYQGNGWALLVETPVSVAFADARENAFNTARFIIPLMLIMALIIILILQRVFIKPVVGLTRVTEDIAKGDLKKRASVTSRDEVGQLGNSFNIMASKLQELYAGLEDKVKEKTAELAKSVDDLRRAKAKDDAILASIGEALIVYDNNGKFVYANKPAEAFIESTAKLDMDHVTSEYGFFASDTKTPIAPEKLPVSRAIQGEEITSEILCIKSHENKEGIFMSVTARPMKDATGDIFGAVVMMRDVTKEKEVDRMKTEFISLASHQLRTPLSAIRWFTEMLLSGDAGKLSSEQTDFTKNIYDSTERMIQLVNSLLNISRMESGRIVVDPKPTDLKELVQGIIVDLKAKIEERNHNLIISVREDLPKINIDPKLIRQVYMNLLTNAIKYTPKGGEIHIFISKKDDEIVSQISDNGYGIPKAQHSKIFEKFFRAENVAKVETDGTGLGLYLIKAIIDSSKGKIWFESEEGKGATFWFTLPMKGMEAKKGEVTLDE